MIGSWAPSAARWIGYATHFCQPEPSSSSVCLQDLSESIQRPTGLVTPRMPQPKQAGVINGLQALPGKEGTRGNAGRDQRTRPDTVYGAIRVTLASGRPVRHAVGVCPDQRRKARVKALASE